MEDYQYISPTINEDCAILIKEQRRIMDALARGEYPISHCNLIIYSSDKPKGYWGVERLPEFMARFQQDILNERSTLCVATAWNEVAEIQRGPLEIDDGLSLPEGTQQVVTNGSLMNMSDFIYGCCLSKALVDKYMVEIAAILLISYDDAKEEDFKRVFTSLMTISQKLTETKPQH